MKIQKFNEDSRSYEDKMSECKYLFKNLWTEKLELGLIGVRINGRNINPAAKVIGSISGKYDLHVSMYKPLNSETYKIFNELFEFLDELNMKFEINTEQWKIIIDIKNMDEFINEMKIRLNINKYNI